jgi:hypothetical protein
MLATDGDQSELSQMARLLADLGEERRAAGADLLDSLHRLLSAAR